MTDNELRAVRQYQDNPLVKAFVDILCQQLGIRPTGGSVMMILNHDGLLRMLELAESNVQAEIAMKMRGTPDDGYGAKVWMKQ